MFPTLTHKFIGALLIAVTTCCAAVFIISVYSMQAPLDDKLDDDIRRMQHIIDSSNEVTFKRLAQAAALLAQNEELVNAVKLFDHEQASRIAAQAMQITSSDLITITDEHGMVIGRGHSKRWNDSIINQETVVSALNNHPATGIVFGTEVPFSLRASHPVVSDGKIVGTLSIGVDLAGQGYIDWLKSLSGMEIGIFKHDTCIMATAIKDGRRPLNEKLSPPELTKEVLQEGKTRFLDHNIFGIEYKAAYWPLRTADGKIAGLWFAGAPLNKLMKIEEEAITKSIKLSVILLVVMLVLFILVGFHVSAPIREISRYITNVTNDKKDASLDIHTNDDMGKLADNLRDMVKKLQARTEKFRDLSYHDQLTNLWNRRYFMEAFQREIDFSVRYGDPLSLGMADIDHFKRVNDTFGHDVGDVVLRHIASLLQKNLRNSDIVARFGGEEFILLLPHTRLETAANVLEKLRQLCERTGIKVNGKTIRVTISFGLVSLPENARLPADALIKRADTALYQSKQNGRNRVTVYQDDAAPDNDKFNPV